MIASAAVVVLGGGDAGAQAQTTVYAYDALGRLTNAGSGLDATRTYRYDNADNRTARTCCVTIGSEIAADTFDPYFYITFYPDIRLAGVDPYSHYMNQGWTENRRPSRYFDPAWYRSTYGVPSNVNPLVHYSNGGWQAGNSPSPEFSNPGYRAAYPDIPSSMDPYWHYLRHGYAEGRQRFPAP